MWSSLWVIYEIFLAFFFPIILGDSWLLFEKRLLARLSGLKVQKEKEKKKENQINQMQESNVDNNKRAQLYLELIEGEFNVKQKFKISK